MKAVSKYVILRVSEACIMNKKIETAFRVFLILGWFALSIYSAFGNASVNELRYGAFVACFCCGCNNIIELLRRISKSE